MRVRKVGSTDWYNIIHFMKGGRFAYSADNGQPVADRSVLTDSWEVELPVLYKRRSDESYDTLRLHLEPPGGDSKHVVLVSTISADNGKRKDKVYRSPVKEVASKPYSQVCFERLEARWRKKKDRSGWTEEKGALTLDEPMLLHEWDDYGAKLFEEHDVLLLSPKLNGIRATYKGTTGTLYSRKRQPFIMPELVKALSTIGMSLDGELWAEGMTLEEIASAVSAQSHPDKGRIEFWAFDKFNGDTYAERMQSVIKRVSMYPSLPVKAVPVVPVRSMREVDEWHKRIEKEGGCDGVVIRAPYYPYIFGIKSKNILRKKYLVSHEFKCVGTTADVDTKYGPLIVLLFETKDGQQFKVVPNWSKERRAHAADQDVRQFIGHMWTLEFREWTAKGKPRHVKAITRRDYE